MRAEHEHSSLTDEETDEFRFVPVLAANVKRLRTEANITKKRFALMVDIGRPFLNKIENGTADPRMSIITRLADALDTPAGELMTNPNAKPRTSVSDVRHAPLY